MTDNDPDRLKFTDLRLVTAWTAIRDHFAACYPGSIARVTRTGGYRTAQIQRECHNDGSSRYDGTNGFSKHQAFPARALDFAVIEFSGGGQRYVSDGSDVRYAWIGREFEGDGFAWGGRWKHPDFDHLEIVGPGPTKGEVLDGFIAYKATEEKANVTKTV